MGARSQGLTGSGVRPPGVERKWVYGPRGAGHWVYGPRGGQGVSVWPQGSLDIVLRKYNKQRCIKIYSFIHHSSVMTNTRAK